MLSKCSFANAAIHTYEMKRIFSYGLNCKSQLIFYPFHCIYGVVYSTSNKFYTYFVHHKKQSHDWKSKACTHSLRTKQCKYYIHKFHNPFKPCNFCTCARIYYVSMFRTDVKYETGMRIMHDYYKLCVLCLRVLVPMKPTTLHFEHRGKTRGITNRLW